MTAVARPQASRRPDPGSTAQGRFEQRIFARRRRGLKLIGALLAVAVIGAGAAWALWRSDWLLVEEVVISGVEPRWNAKILDAAAIEINEPLVEVDTSAAETAVATVPIVRDVQVVRSWPSAVTIKVTPRKPVLAAQRAGGRVSLIDSDGVTIETVQAPPDGVPVIVTKGGTGSSAQAYQSTWGVLSTLPPEIAELVTKVTVSSADLVTLKLGSRTLVWGGPDDGELKGEVAKALLATDAKRIDVSAPRSPVTRGTVETGDDD